MGPVGLWIGLGTSLLMAGILLFILFLKKMRSLRFEETEDSPRPYPIVLGHNPH
jgi:Na+-driven multidrug efflux pump